MVIMIKTKGSYMNITHKKPTEYIFLYQLYTRLCLPYQLRIKTRSLIISNMKSFVIIN